MMKKISTMIIVIMVLQIVLPMLTIILESDFTIKSIAAEALEATVDGITWIYEVEDEKAVKVKPKDVNTLPEEVIIPSELNGYIVTSIGESAFEDCSNLTSIEIPERVTSIGDYTFSECKNLTNIEIPEGVTSIGISAFSGCSSLASIEIPEGVTNIGSNMFSGCSNLKSIELPEKVRSIGTMAFYECSNLTSIEIPEGVTKIGASTFSGCSSLSSIKILAELATIGDWAFSGCSSLTSIEFPEGVMSIGGRAFENCSNLTSIELPEEATNIGEKAFLNCSSLKNIEIPKEIRSIGNFAFYGCGSLESINVEPENQNYTSEEGVLFNKEKTTIICYPPNKKGIEYIIRAGVTNIEPAAFANCSMLANIEFPEGVTTIGARAFEKCSSLKSIEIPGTVTKIEEGLFYECFDLASVEISNGVTSIGDYAFWGCLGLINIEIPEGVTKIGEEVFSSCGRLKNIKVESENENYTSENGVLFDKEKTTIICYPAKKEGTEYIIPAGVISVGKRAFKNVSNLTSVRIPVGVTNIEEAAFYNCSNLISIKIPEGVTSLGESVFENCTSLASIEIPEGVTAVSARAFYWCISLTSIEIPEGITTIEDYAFYNCSKLRKITIPKGVTNIKSRAFSNCNNLTIYCNSESLAETYAKKNDIKHVIDDEAPTITSVEGISEEWAKGSVILTVSANDSLSGLARKAYSFDGGESWQEENTKEYTESTNGIVIKVRDSLGNETTYEEEINITKIAKVEKIEIKAEPTKKEYVEGEVLDTAGLVIRVTYNNGTPGEIIEELAEEVTDGVTCTPERLDTAGQQEITVTYGEKTATFSVNVIKKADVNGDNKIDFIDMLQINRHRLGKIKLEGINLRAADVNGDNKVDFMDMLKVNQYRLGKSL